MTRPVLRIIYFSFVYPALIYGYIVWGSCGSTLLSSLYVIQKKIIRVMTSSHRLEHSAPPPLFKNAYLLSLPDLNRYSSTIYAFNCLKNARRDIFSLTEPQCHFSRLSTSPVIIDGH